MIMSYELNILIDRETAEKLYLYCQTEGRDPFTFASTIIKNFLDRVYNENEPIQADFSERFREATSFILN
jgi:hypothetical protein